MSTPPTIRFADLAIHAALQRALAARGYDSPTPVQEAVMGAAAAGRDLLVSSQTGSGKTIAFGAALAATLLEGADGAAAVVRKAGAPRALVIVPTRELAAQVRGELGWLLAGTPLRLAAFTGGTAVSGDLRALHRGVDVAIGTPGRLVDLMRREKLVLGQLSVVVLDEADEMLDLGFREDLETLLGAAPVERRTLLLSATLPSEIRALARRFQRDALAIDPRKDAPDAGAGGRAAPGSHDDITYVAHLIAGGDHLAAVVNLLRASEDSRAIVFCTTREGVGGLHRELLARGFAATAMSGERAQAERDRALDQVRQGEARILVATNVAARGLDLPDVDLIIHADLPLNADSLTHRSGRTGRAGRKGTAVVIASLSERRKAERLLAAAHVRVPWTAPPSGKQITAAARSRLVASLLASGADDAAASVDADTTSDPDAVIPSSSSSDPSDDLLAPFLGKLSMEDLARRLLARELDRLPTGETLAPVMLPSAGGDRRFGPAGGEGPPRRRGPGEIARDGVMFRVNLGAQDQADPRWLLPLICRRGGVTRREVGAIRVGPRETLFEIAGDAAQDFALAASVRDPRAPNVRMERAGGDSSAPARAAPGALAHAVEPAPSGAAVQPARTPSPKPRHAEPRPAKAHPHPATKALPAKGEEKPSHGNGEAPYTKPRPTNGDAPYTKPRSANGDAPRASWDEPVVGEEPQAKPAFGKPAHAKAPFGKPAHAKAPFGKPARTKAPFTKAPFGKPAHAKPPFTKAPFGKPAHAKPPFAKPHAKAHHQKSHGPRPQGPKDHAPRRPGDQRKG